MRGERGGGWGWGREEEDVVGAETLWTQSTAWSFPMISEREWARLMRDVRLGMVFEVSWRRERRDIGLLLEGIPSGVSKTSPKRQASSLVTGS